MAIPPTFTAGTAAVLFPAFASEYTGGEAAVLASLGGELEPLLARAARAASFDADAFRAAARGVFADELQSQLGAYLWSAAFSGAVGRIVPSPRFAAAYSQGLYAALAHVRSVSFEEGLRLIEVSYRLVERCVGGRRFGMAVVTGLDPAQVASLCPRAGEDVQVINVNNPLSAVVAGPAGQVERLVAAAKEAGALGARSLPVRVPYHSRLVEPAAAAFREHLGGVEIRDAACDIVSHIDQRVVRRREEIVDLLAANISRPFDWLATMRALLARGADTFVECGAGGSLRRVARFIEGDYRFLSMADLRDAAAACAGGGGTAGEGTRP